jgi:hypothetical protein
MSGIRRQVEIGGKDSRNGAPEMLLSVTYTG